MCGTTNEQPFRVHLIFYDELKSVQVVPLGGVPSAIANNEGAGGMLHGSDDVASFIAGIEIDSIVQTRQLADQPLTFERVFHLRAPSQIISEIERRFEARWEADVKILEGEPLTEGDTAALSYFEDIVLGSTRLRPIEGFHLTREWFARRQRSAG